MADIGAMLSFEYYENYTFDMISKLLCIASYLFSLYGFGFLFDCFLPVLPVFSRFVPDQLGALFTHAAAWGQGSIS